MRERITFTGGSAKGASLHPTANSAIPLYIFVHCPKTGGTSVRYFLYRSMGSGDVAMLDGDAEHRDSKLEELRSRGEALKLVMGHSATLSLKQYFAPREVRWVTILREPCSYLVSRFNYAMKDARLEADTAETEAKFRAFCEGHRNRQARWFISIFAEQPIVGLRDLDARRLAGRATEILRDFWHVGRLENLRESIAPLFVALGVSAPFNVHLKRAGKDHRRLITLTDELRRHAERYTEADRLIYDEFSAAKGQAPP